MKKQIVTACALIASVAAVAASVTSDNMFGILKVTSTATSSAGAELIIPIPWVTVGNKENKVNVTDYILTTGRISGVDGDRILWFDQSTGKYTYYYIDATTGNWTGVNTEYKDEKGDDQTITAPTAVSRGSAALLKLVVNSTSPVFISGEYASETVTTTVVGPTAEAKEKNDNEIVYNLIAPSSANGVALNNMVIKKGDNAATPGDLKGDVIFLDDGTVYNYGTVTVDESEVTGWYKKASSSKGTPDTNPTLEGGKGAWYIRTNAGDITITW